MAYVSNPFVYFRCAGCGRNIDMQISARRAAKEIDRLRDEPALYCAGCAPSPAHRQPAPPGE